ncbi:gamma-glutamyl-gamma-aminobutyrate hydrolase [Zobellella aerophila]|uniref:Gamma-glutamyl-gamma-aminobutyrate hydrolase n=1 Tax=Zobellella aerophila TaxID=870480 RepID=A0ABP6VUD0_9GAMM
MVYISNMPVVGVIMCRQPVKGHPSHTVQDKYLNALLDAGAIPLPLVHGLLQDDHHLQQLLPLLDGVLLTGSPSNIEPHHYGESGDEPHVDPGRDRLSFRLIDESQRLNMPLLGICRGFQEMVVATGGTLHRRLHEVGGFIEHREDKDQPLSAQYGHAHAVTALPDSLLARLSGATEHRVNSLHMQGVKSLGAGLVEEAHGPDGLVEAVRLVDHPFALGVQWHPEWQSRDNPLSRTLFDGFIGACRRYREEK